MKCIRVCIFLLAWAGALAPMVSPAMLRAQSNPPFKNPALDSNCYFPQIGDPTEMDTILGSEGQNLGELVKNLGPKPDGSFGNMFIQNISPTVALAQVATGPTFNLHQMKQYVQSLVPNGTNGVADGFTLGHFRDRSHLDILAGGRIYWADDNGNYDSSSYTELWSHLRGDRDGWGEIIAPFAGYFTRDTIEDIVYGLATDWVDITKDTSYLMLYKGGESLYQQDTAYEDTSRQLFPNLINFPYRQALAGDFRGTGRSDIVIQGRTVQGDPGSHDGDLFFFANDPPFSLEKLAQAINYDTLMAQWQDSIEGGFMYAIPVFPKNTSDHSADFVLLVAPASTGINAIYMFRGGSDFGSHRMTLDSAGFILLPPNLGYGTNNWPFAMGDAGDMTGTGNHVLYTSARNDFSDYWWDNFFVMGEALDNKVDIYNSHPYSESIGDTLTANDDSLEDYLFGLSWPDGPGGVDGGALWLYYGTKEIPVHLNPQFADVKSIPQENGAGIMLSPNPTQLWSVATIIWPEAENAEYEVYNILGNVMQKGNIRLLGGAEQQRIYFSNLASGVYMLVIHGESHEARVKLVIAR